MHRPTVRRWAIRVAVVGLLCASPRPSWCAWTNFNVTDGLAANEVNAIAEDREGFLWFGTSNGLSRYDGARWKTYTVADGLPGNQVCGLLCARDGALWVSTDGGVCRSDGDRWVKVSTTAREGGCSKDLVEDRHGNMWFAGNFMYSGWLASPDEGLLRRFDGSTWKVFSTADGLPVDYGFTGVFEDHNGTIWASTLENGVCSYDGTSWRNYTVADGLPRNDVDVIGEDSSGVLWVMLGGYPSLAQFDGTRWTSAPLDWAGCAMDVCAARGGGMWIATPGCWGCCWGVVRYDGLGWRHYWPQDGIATGDVFCVFEDHLGVLWAGTKSNGVNRFDGSSWMRFTGESAPQGNWSETEPYLVQDRDGDIWAADLNGVETFDRKTWTWRRFGLADGLPSRYVWGMTMDRDGAIWIATRGGGVAVTRDHSTWRTFSTADGLADTLCWSILADRAGNIWVGTQRGVSRYDGSSWRTFTTADGLHGDFITVMMEDRAGRIWMGSRYSTGSPGVSVFDGTSFRAFGAADGVGTLAVLRLLEDPSGAIWCGGTLGSSVGAVSRFDGSSWRTFKNGFSLGVSSMAADRVGRVWVGIFPPGGGVVGGASYYDGTDWHYVSAPDGPLGTIVYSITQDHGGALWFGTDVGLSRFDGERWCSFSTTDGLAGTPVIQVVEDSVGVLWIGSSRYITAHVPDRVPPRTVFTAKPPPVSANTIPIISYAAGFKESAGIEFSYSLDGAPWSEWSREGAWPSRGMAGGRHVMEVRSRDRINNVDPAPARAEFEIDATPPVPLITSPASGQVVRDSVLVVGTAQDARFASYRVEVGRVGAAAGDSLMESRAAVVEGVLCGWTTTRLADGEYELRLSVRDTLGLTGTALTRVIVDNHEPWASVTSPARVTAEVGGDIYTTNAEAHLYFPPRGLAEDGVVTMGALSTGEVPATQAGGAELVHAGYRLDWGQVALRKPATLEMSYVGGAPGAGKGLALYVAGPDSVWRRMGGTVDANIKRISLAVTEEGRYALYAEAGSVAGAGGLTNLSFTPRVFSARGNYANRDVAIGFSLGRAGTVTVKVYNRAGRLVREVVAGQSFAAGANLVRWDGRNREGAMVEPGLYVVAVEALGETQSRPVAVVR